jgi:hypothetical protein
MFHQYEEHAKGTFLEWYKRMMPGIAPFLTERKLLVVNLVVVWLGFLVALYAAFLVRPALGLAAPYLAFVNAFMHIGQFLRWRCYNPGLWTALRQHSAESIMYSQKNLSPPPDRPEELAHSTTPTCDPVDQRHPCKL